MEQRVLHALTKCPLFAGMTSVEIEVSMAGVSYSIVNYDNHDIYALTGMPCKTLDIVVRGVLVCRMSSLSGRQVEVSRLREGNLVAPAFIFGKDNSRHRSAHAEACVPQFDRHKRADSRQLYPGIVEHQCFSDPPHACAKPFHR